MPSYVFAGPYPTYMEGRDASGRNLGTVEPGDIRIFDDPPAGRFWVPEIPPGGGLGETGAEDEGPGGSEGAAGEPGTDAAAQDENPETSTPGE